MKRIASRAGFVLAASAALVLGAAGVASADPAEPGTPGGEAYNEVDDLLDGLICDGPLGPLLGQLVNCDPEDEPPFTSVPDEPGLLPFG